MLYNNKSKDRFSQDPHMTYDDVLDKSQGVYRFVWHIENMNCASCAQKIASHVKKIEGVDNATLLFSTEKLIVNSNNADIGAAIEKAVQSLGYSLRPEQPEQTKTTQTPHKHGSFKFNSMIIPAIMVIIMVASFAIGQFIDPVLGQYGFIAATLLGLMPILKKSLFAIKKGMPFAIETLMSISAIGALFINAAEEASLVLLLFMIGEMLEAFASNHARKGVKSLMALMPESSTVIKDDKRIIINSVQLKPGDIIEVSAGGRLPADGELLSAIATIDESALTGESIPVEHQQFDKLAAGTLVVDRLIQLKVVSEPGKNAVNRILQLIEDAEERKAPIERFINKFSQYYTPIIICIALLVLLIPTLFFNQPWHPWIYRCLTLLLIGCPCALIISTPAAIASAMASATQQGGLIKGGAALEVLGRIQTVAFDKTGTLTLGKPKVTNIICNPFVQEKKLMQLAAAIEIGSTHPLAIAIVEKAVQMRLRITEAEKRQEIPGKGIVGRIQGNTFVIIAPNKLPAEFINLNWQQTIAQLEQEGKTVVAIVNEKSIFGIIALQDELRPEAKETLEKLRHLGLQSVMLTGDNQRTAQNIAKQLSIDYYAELLPEDKVSKINELNNENPTAMIGDGINDAPAMKSAAIGIAMGNATDVALETADAALSSNNLLSLPKLIALSKATNRNIKQNVTLALGLKVIFLITSILGITGLWVAVLADSGATALVTANALRLLKKR